MPTFLKKLRLHKNATLSGFLLIFIMLPLLLFAIKQQQDVRQRASELQMNAAINIQAKGTPCENTYPTMILKVDRTEVKRWENVGSTLQTYSYTGSIPDATNNIVIEFPNDCYHDTNEDRNLYIDSIELNGKKISGNIAGVINTALGTGENKKWLFTNGALIVSTQLFADTPAPSPIGISCTPSPASDTILSMSMTSSSTDDPRLAVVKAANKAYVDYLATNTQNYVGLINFSNDSLPLTNNYTNVKESIDLTPARTDPNDNLVSIFTLAFRAFTTGRPNVPKKLILFSAGKPDTSTEQSILQNAQTFKENTNWQIYVIGLGDNINETLLQNIATITNGKYYHVDQIDQLQDTYMAIEKGTISGSVFDDNNSNGVLDKDESGEFSWPVNVYSTTDQLLLTLKSDSTGKYSYNKFCPGQTYVIKGLSRPSWDQTVPASMSGYTVAVTKDSVATDKNFGFKVVPTPTYSPVTPTITPTVTPIPTEKNVINWTNNYASLTAKDFYIEVGGKKFYANTADVKLSSDPGNLSYRTLEATWHENDVEMRYFIYFAADAYGWKVTEMRTYDGNANGTWVYYKGFEGSVYGQALYKGIVDFPIERSDTHVQGKIHMEQMRLIPFFTPPIIVTPSQPVTPSVSPTIDLTHAIILDLNVLLHGIGTSGDNVSSESGSSNKNPQRPVRTASIELLDSQNQLVSQTTGEIKYASGSGDFSGKIALGLPSTQTASVTGPYTVRIKADQYLTNRIPGIYNFTVGQTYTLPNISLVAGDVNNDNRLNILDWNVLYDCFTGQIQTVPHNCDNETKKKSADLNDDGTVNVYDQNIWLRELSVQHGL